MKHYRLSDQTPLKTKRLLLTPMSEKELTARIDGLEDELLKGAYTEMRRCVVAYPDQALWHTSWRMSLREGGETVGYVGFHGVARDKTVELGYDVLQQHRNKGYATEATKALVDWAFCQENVYFVHAMADEANDASNHILESLKFYRVESGLEGQTLWEIERPASAWMAIYMCIGLGAGMALGTGIYGNQVLGMMIGLSAGLALGVSLDSQDRAARKRDAEPKEIGVSEKKAK